MGELTLFGYPWDLVADTAGTVGRIRELGADRLAVAVAYHSAELITGRPGGGPAVTTAEPNRAHLPLPAGTFSGLALPPSRLATEHSGLFDAAAGAAATHGLDLTAWVVTLHNSDLAESHPEAGIVSCFGDVFRHGLCPTNPAVRAYCRELVGAVCASGLFRAVFAESVSALLYGHGHPHELHGVHLGPVLKFLLSLCFCEHCTAAAQGRGVDVERLRSRVRAVVGARLDDATGTSGLDAPDALSSLLMNWPELYHYTRARCDEVTSLTVEIAAIVHAHAMEFQLSAPVWGRPSSLNWLEGVTIADAAAAADCYVIECYHAALADVRSDLAHALMFAEPDRLAAALTLWPIHHDGPDDFLSKVRYAHDQGIERLYLYNYSTATSRSLEWVRLAARELAH